MKQLKMSDNIQMPQIAYYLFFALMIFAKGIGLDSGNRLYYILSGIACICVGVKLVLTKYRIREIAAMVLLCAIAFMAYRNSGRLGIVLSVLTVIGLKGMDVKKLFRMGTVIYGCSFAFTVTAAKFGLIRNPLVVHEKGGMELIRWGMGYSTGNVFHVSYFMLAVLLCYTWGKRYNWKRLLGLMAGNLLVFLYTLSYTGVLVTAFYLLLDYYAVKRKRLSAAEKILCQLPLPFCLLFSFGAPFLLKYPVMQKLDSMLQARLTFSAYYLQNQPITLLGARMKNVPNFWVIMDNGYVYFFMTFGIAAFVLFCIGYAVVIGRYSGIGQWIGQHFAGKGREWRGKKGKDIKKVKDIKCVEEGEWGMQPSAGERQLYGKDGREKNLAKEKKPAREKNLTREKNLAREMKLAREKNLEREKNPAKGKRYAEGEGQQRWHGGTEGLAVGMAEEEKSRERLPELAMIFSFLLYGIMEQFLSNAFMNFSLLFMGEVLFGKCGVEYGGEEETGGRRGRVRDMGEEETGGRRARVRDMEEAETDGRRGRMEYAAEEIGNRARKEYGQETEEDGSRWSGKAADGKKRTGEETARKGQSGNKAIRKEWIRKDGGKRDKGAVRKGKYFLGLACSATGLVIFTVYYLAVPMKEYIRVPVGALNYVEAQSILINVAEKEDEKDGLRKKMNAYGEALEDADILGTALYGMGMEERLSAEELAAALEYSIPVSVHNGEVYDTFRVRLLELYYDITEDEYRELLERIVALVQEKESGEYSVAGSVYWERIGKSAGDDRIEHMSKDKDYEVEKAGNIVKAEHFRDSVFFAALGMAVIWVMVRRGGR